MAKIIKKNCEPPHEKGSGSKAAAVFFIIAVLSAIAFFIFRNYLIITVSGLSLFISLCLLSISLAKRTREREIKSYGNAGERRAGAILEERLPDGYTVIQNAVIRYGNGVSETDNIIVGKTGVFIIEVKYLKGSVLGNYEWHDWIQDKTDRYGIEHKKQFYSPVKQVKTHIYRLANYLRDNKVFTHISGAVYFSNPDAHVTVRGEENDVPVFSYYSTDELLRYIMSGRENLSDKTVNRIVDLINK